LSALFTLCLVNTLTWLPLILTSALTLISTLILTSALSSTLISTLILTSALTSTSAVATEVEVKAEDTM